MLTSPPILAYPDYDLPFVLHTDASNEGLGAVLYQQQGNKLRVIAYGSRTLTPAEKNYHLHSSKLEFLALKWAICDKFRDYLYYAPTFTVYTDNNPLTYVLSSARLNAVGHRWVGELADFHFTIKYRPGKSNTDADTLSRHPVHLDGHLKEFTETVSPDVVSAIWQGDTAVKDGDVPWVAALQLQSDVNDAHFGGTPVITPESVRDAQKKMLLSKSHRVSPHLDRDKDRQTVTETTERQWSRSLNTLRRGGIHILPSNNPSIQQEENPVQTPDQQAAVPPPAQEVQGELITDDTAEEADSREQEDNDEPAVELSEEEVQPVRRSARAQRPREMLTYDTLGQPSYQSWGPGANLMFAYAPYPMSHLPLPLNPCPIPSFYPAFPEHCFYPAQAVWTC
ncbi:hypothetical protein D4764_02G0001070 [Takifugu flavidus]|uniref:Reverse transcriptase RNase H-like domain-containing protein n=1 Tax=Takifugu flavidus TaxID=433684 RepID=A0A5C6NIX7_9TELE|nr:hypothetical protein D4764_02G0001070 [Takifugu flavidus]